MKIAIDISSIIYQTGVSRYTEKLVENLLKIDSDNEYLLFGGSLRQISVLKSRALKFKGQYKSKFFPLAPTLTDFLWNRLHLFPVEKLIGKIDVYHSSDWAQAPSQAFKVTTMHDVWPLRSPQQTPKKVLRAHQARLKWVKKEVDKIIVPSEATKQDLAEYGLEAQKIVVIPEACAEIFSPQNQAQIKKIKKTYQIHGRYLLAIGVGQRKNTARIIRAYEKIKKGDLKLVLVGLNQEGIEIPRGVCLLGRISDEELPCLYSGAQALVYPSLHEGFGLPILEAFSCHCPVVTSSVSSMPEVAGNAAVLVDPQQTESIIAGIGKALRQRKSLIDKGERQVKKFTWEKTAGKTLKIYQEAK